MGAINEPSHDHTQFDALCAGVDDFETLPAVTAAPPLDAAPTDPDDPDDSGMNAQILAGLVSPS
jgi:hypothetical protein